MTPSDRPRVLITGLGLVTPLGYSAWETFSALLAGRTIADRAGVLEPATDPVNMVRALGCVSFAQHSAVDPAIDLAERAAREAMFMAGIDEPATLEGIVGTSKGAMHALTPSPSGRGWSPRRPGEGTSGILESDPKPTTQQTRKSPHPSPLPKGEGARVVALGPQAFLAHHLSNRLGTAGLTCTVAACASGLTALHQARERLIHGTSDGSDGPHRLLVVSSEASLLPMFIHSYHRLGVLPPLTPGHYRGRPLDERRNGFMLAEVGVAVVLEQSPPLQSKIENQKSEIELLDTAIAAEGYDLIRSNPELPALRHVAQKLCAGRTIDAIHPHATGTSDHDPAELGVHASLQPTKPCIYANKGALGHTLGASGLVSLVIACLSAKARRLPPMPWLDRPITSSFSLGPASQPLPPHSTHAVFSAGFGGHTAGAVISACPVSSK